MQVLSACRQCEKRPSDIAGEFVGVDAADNGCDRITTSERGHFLFGKTDDKARM